MCGIAGMSGEHEQAMKQMTRALKHRGPDGDAIVIAQGASLGHARLAILDPRPVGDQPMWNEDHTIAIVFNGEIFNYRELRAQEQFSCKTETDTEVVLKLYERHGPRFVRKLRGMFAFGIYDTRTRTFVLARDTSGIKPLYVTHEGGLAFASEMRALLTVFPAKPRLNMRSLSMYLRLQYVPGPETMCEGIECLPPGTMLTWHEGKETRETFTADVAALPDLRTRAQFTQNFPGIMDDAVKCHMISDKPIGLFLSGGMDSSIVLHHMAQHTKEPVRTFTVRFEASAQEGSARVNADADLAKKTAEHYGTKHTEILLTAEDYRQAYADTAVALDQPNSDHVSVAQFLLAKKAKQDVDVVLNGSGGDELFGGYPRYRIAKVLRRFRFVPSGWRALAAMMAGHPGDVLAMQPGPELWERLLARPLEESRSIVRGNWFQPHAPSHLFTAFAHKHASKDPLRTFFEMDRHLWLVDESLRLTDGTTMGSGLEARVPFLDPQVIAASLSTPAQWHVSLTRTKALLKDTYSPILPAHLFSLDKASFYPPLSKWLRREAWMLVEEMLEDPRIAEYFDIAELRRIAHDHREHRRYGLHTLSSMIQLSHWFRAVYDAPSSHS